MTVPKHRQPKKGDSAPELAASNPVVLEVWARAAGRCQFFGCPEYLLKDNVTDLAAKLGDVAHIVARKRKGPRGNDPLPLEKRNELENLMLACPNHHKRIDNKRLEARYPVHLLRQYKHDHEERIFALTSLGPDCETAVIRLVGKIREDVPTISDQEVRTATLESLHRVPRFLAGKRTEEINLAGLPSRSASYWTVAREIISEEIRRIKPDLEQKKITHLSIFALARIWGEDKPTAAQREAVEASSPREEPVRGE